MTKNPIQFQKGLSLKAFKEQYGTEEQCCKALFRWRWPKGYRCPKCGHDKCHSINGHKVYQCYRCHQQSSILAGTIFHSIKLPLTTLFLIRYLMTRSKYGISSPVLLRIYSLLRPVWRNLKVVLRNTCHTMLSDEYCWLYFNWNTRSHHLDKMKRIHWCYTRVVWHSKKLYALTSTVAWPLRAAIFAWKRTRKYGPLVKQKTGITISRQLLDQLYLVFRHFIPPRAYYFYGLYDPSNRNLAPMYLHDHETIPLLLFLNASNELSILTDKRLFFTKCKSLGLPTIPIIAEFEDGKIKRWVSDTNKELPKVDLFAKPARGKCGQGLKLFKYEESDCYRSDDGILLTHDELLYCISECSRESPYILQERLFNHQAISELHPGALCTTRVVTCRAPAGSVEHLASIFKMPRSKCINDNLTTGGIAIAVDETSGVLGRGITKDLAADRVDRHPDTGRKIVGVRIPYWHQLIQLCLQAHEAFPTFPFVGWDVGVTENGPVLVEGNPDCGFEGVQRAHNRPLGESRFAEIFISHMEHHSQSRTYPDLKYWPPRQDLERIHEIRQTTRTMSRLVFARN